MTRLLVLLTLLLALLLPGQGWAVIAKETHSQGTNTAAGVTATEPASSTSGDVFIAFVHTEGSATGLTRPSGWTNLYNGTSSEVVYDYDVSYIVRGGSAPALNWTWTGSAYYEYYIVRFSGVDGTTPINNAGSLTNNFNGVPDPPAITPSGGLTNTMAVIFGIGWCGSDTGGFVAPTNYTIAVTPATGLNAAVAYRQLASASAEDPAAWTGITDCGQNVTQSTITLTTGSGGGGPTLPPIGSLGLMGVGR
jgi:hypothetical protein